MAYNDNSRRLCFYDHTAIPARYFLVLKVEGDQRVRIQTKTNGVKLVKSLDNIAGFDHNHNTHPLCAGLGKWYVLPLIISRSISPYKYKDLTDCSRD